MTENSCYPGCYAIEGTPRVIRPPCQTGDILWVRETWARLPASPGGHFRPNGVYYYRADEDIRPEQYKSSGWRPAIHMPKVAARIFLRVAGVQAERLREVTWESAAEEGCVNPMRFDELWDSTIKPAERHLYGWEANPWVWVITFERMDKSAHRRGSGGTAGSSAPGVGHIPGVGGTGPPAAGAGEHPAGSVRLVGAHAGTVGEMDPRPVQHPVI